MKAMGDHHFISKIDNAIAFFNKMEEITFLEDVVWACFIGKIA